MWGSCHSDESRNNRSKTSYVLFCFFIVYFYNPSLFVLIVIKVHNNLFQFLLFNYNLDYSLKSSYRFMFSVVEKTYSLYYLIIKVTPLFSSKYFVCNFLYIPI